MYVRTYVQYLLNQNVKLQQHAWSVTNSSCSFWLSFCSTSCYCRIYFCRLTLKSGWGVWIWRSMQNCFNRKVTSGNVIWETWKIWTKHSSKQWASTRKVADSNGEMIVHVLLCYCLQLICKGLWGLLNTCQSQQVRRIYISQIIILIINTQWTWKLWTGSVRTNVRWVVRNWWFS